MIAMHEVKTQLTPQEYGSYYSIKVKCDNCTHEQAFYILCGIPAIELFHDCPRCMCRINLKTGLLEG